MRKLITGLVLGTALFLGGCGVVQTPPEDNKHTQADRAAKAAGSINFSENAEIDNIKNRLELTSKPSAIGYVLLMNQAGQPIAYYGVKGKITSSGKRLTAPVQQWKTDLGTNGNGTQINVSPSDEGTWGSSDPYIFFWTTDGQYIQWNGAYLYSDLPFRTRVEPLVISVK